MMIKRYCAVFAAVLLICAAPTLAEAQSAASEPSVPGVPGDEDEEASRSGRSAPEPVCQTYGGRRGQMFVRGDIGERQCAITYLSSYTAPGPLRLPSDADREADVNAALEKLGHVDRGVGYLRDYYALRARRQQMMMDVQASIVFVAALGAAAASGTPASSQRVWAFTAFAPVLTSQVNANEPTRNLFHGGGLALDLLSARYAKLIELRRALGGVGAVPTCFGSSETGLAASRRSIRAWNTSDTLRRRPRGRAVKDLRRPLPRSRRMPKRRSSVTIARRYWLMRTVFRRAAGL